MAFEDYFPAGRYHTGALNKVLAGFREMGFTSGSQVRDYCERVWNSMSRSYKAQQPEVAIAMYMEAVKRLGIGHA